MTPKLPERFACPFCQSFRGSGQGMSYLPHMQVYVCYACAEANGLAQINAEEITNKVQAKWTAEQVESLSAYQASPHYFPFVCEQGDIFEATSVGLFCPRCEELIKWTYPWTLDWSWKTEI
jgi:hypothetical protein